MRTGVAAIQRSPSQWENTITARHMPRHAEELIGPECLWHQNTLLLVVPLDPHSTTFAAGAPPVNLTNDFLAAFLEALRNGTTRSHPSRFI